MPRVDLSGRANLSYGASLLGIYEGKRPRLELSDELGLDAELATVVEL